MAQLNPSQVLAAPTLEKISTHKLNRPLMHELLLRLYALQGMNKEKYGLENMWRLADSFDHPENSFRSIHIAGTNGKGSTAHKIAASLTDAGYKTALFTSPHLSCIRERIRINGEMISEETFALLLPDLPGTFFELITMTALRYFAQEKVDYAVIETGLGGRLDATNIITPVLSIITSIAKDHESILGDSLEQIAKEKAGIIKPNIPVILGPNTPHLTSPLKVEGSFKTFDEENSAIAQMALEYLGVPVQSIEKGIGTRPACRMEVIPYKDKFVILDVAHNTAGIKALFQSLTTPPDTLLFAASDNKDIDGLFSVINGQDQSIWITEGGNPRRAPARKLATHLGRSCQVIPDCKAAFKDAIQNTPSGGRLLCFGTFFIMSQIRSCLGIQEPCDPSDLNEKG
ncbi:MAG: Mur ligase family protein [Waddliaceae bacterium]